ncbi:hypothetical protein K435DRAFT_807434 [Dendrothele bispora CBS 962.96]|uniref:Uncharacterized protein n=1 Tax=Dendrothele bispora (strain CBS 962.96) TaxID=1314807 RepID=A0A4S8L4Q7_DENBC|nr:hypothetical protein K435DRAFT_807434 [Dendrothele bispora CBS 962.96]
MSSNRGRPLVRQIKIQVTNELVPLESKPQRIPTMFSNLMRSSTNLCPVFNDSELLVHLYLRIITIKLLILVILFFQYVEDTEANLDPKIDPDVKNLPLEAYIE